MRELPAELVDALGVARRVEQAAVTGLQRQHAQRVLSRLLCTARRSGWLPSELAPVVGLHRETVRSRAERASVHELVPLGIDLPAPPTPPVEPEPVLSLPPTERDVFTAAEAAELCGVTVSTIKLWREGGLLPNTDRSVPCHYLYARDDLERIAAARLPGSRYHRWRTVMASTEESPPRL